MGKRIKSTLLLTSLVFAIPAGITVPIHNAEAIELAPSPVFEYSFSSTGTLVESSTLNQSTSPYWWLRKGGKLAIGNGVGKTIHGNLPQNDPLRVKYAAELPTPSDIGYHPQNIFRLITKGSWTDYQEQATVKLNASNLSNVANRNPWNGVSLLGRYQDENNYYYASVRADGRVSIKKKKNGSYYTLKESPFFPGTYNVNANPNLIPVGSTMGLRLEIYTNDDNTVSLKFLVDRNNNNDWTLAAETIDSGSTGGSPITLSGKGGIWSDFADLEMDNYKVTLFTNGGSTPPPPPPPPPTSGYGLSQDINLAETGSSNESPSPYWWVNSGAYFNVVSGVGKTTQGNLPSNDPWRIIYSNANPLDTDNGYHPQNIFRLITKSSWQNFTEQAYFKLNKYNVSASPNRDGHNAFLFFNRYISSQSLYYTGLRVDGNIVIKKKLNGSYTTLKMVKILPGTYNRDTNPNLIPLNTWIGLKSVVNNNSNGSVSIKVYLDNGQTGNWTLVAEATDSNQPITAGAPAGVRTDFMDIEFKEYNVTNL